MNEEDEDTGSGTEAENTAEEDEPERDLSQPVVVQETVWDFANEQPVELEVTIAPFMRDTFEGQDHISGNMTYEVISEDGEYGLDHYGTAPAEVRLFDPEDPRFLYYPNAAGTESQGDFAADVESPVAAAGEGPVRWASIYTDPGTDTISVLLPYVGLVEDAEEALDSAVEELQPAPGGELQISGHTDNVDTEQFNQTLSENRAEAVHERLSELMDLDAFDEASIEGHSLREPVASNDTEEGRQANRRVEISFTPAESEELDDMEDAEDSGGMPQAQAQGPVAEAEEPVTVTAADGRASEVTVEQVYRTGDVLVGRVSVEVSDLPEDTDGTGTLAWPLSFGETGVREEHDNDFNPGTQTHALTLLVGNQRIFPLEYGGDGHIEIGGDGEVIEMDHPWYMPVTDRGFGYQAPAVVGTRATATVVWPNVPGETVIIDVPGETEHAQRPYSDPFRITDVPVTEAGSGDSNDDGHDADQEDDQ